MEIVKTGDVPALITNIEVLQILSKNRRNKENENETSNQETNNKDDRQLQHKYWIDEHVYEYIKSATPCGNANPKRMPELVHVLKQGSVVGETKCSTTAVKEEEGINGDTSHEDVISSCQGFGLSDAANIELDAQGNGRISFDYRGSIIEIIGRAADGID